MIGRINDVTLYRELTRRGVSDYLIAPVGTIDVVRSICGLFSAPDAKPVGRIIAVVGAKGGVGASTVAHNIAWAIARDLGARFRRRPISISPFGTAGLDYNQDPPQGIADAVFSPDRIDTAFVDRLLSKCTDHLSLLAAPATLDRVYDFGAEAFDSIIDTLAQHDALHRARRAASVDRLDAAAAGRRRRHPDRRRARPRQSAQRQEHGRSAARGAAERPSAATTASTRSACRSGRKSRRPISPRRWKTSRSRSIPFEPQLFGTAANNGQMIAEVSSSHKTAEMFRQLAQVLTGRAEAKRARGGLLTPLLGQADEAVGVMQVRSSTVVFGKRSGSDTQARRRRRVRRRPPRRSHLRRTRRRRRRRASDAPVETGRTPFPSAGLGAPLVSAPSPTRAPASVQMVPTATDTRRSESLLRDQGHDLRRADRGDRPGAAGAARRRFRARGNPRHRQRDHRDQEHRDVDLRAGRAARRHLQRRARLRPARAAAGARRHRRHHGERLRHGLHRSQRQDSEDRHPLPRQPAAPQHLPAHRQPDRPPRRRSLADLRRAPARRLARQRHRAAAGDRRPRAHHPQVQEGQADARSARQVRHDHASRAPKSSRSSAAAASTRWSPAAPAPARRRCSTA